MRSHVLSCVLFVAVMFAAFPGTAAAQEVEDIWEDVALPIPNLFPTDAMPVLPPADEIEEEAAVVYSEPIAVPKRPYIKGRPFLRTAASLMGSAGAFAYAQSRPGVEPDALLVPIAAGVLGGSMGGLLFTNAHPLKVVLGSALATLPAGALATFLAGVTPDDQQAEIPLIAFSIPHGLLTSAFAQQR